MRQRARRFGIMRGRQKGEWVMDDVSEHKQESHGCLCAILGMFFGPIGLIVAAIIGGAKGVVSALIGMIVPVIAIILFFVLGGLAAITM